MLANYYFQTYFYVEITSQFLLIYLNRHIYLNFIFL